MPSNLLNQALEGHEHSLIELTWKIQNGKLTDNELFEIQARQNGKKPIENLVHYNYALALLFTFGAKGFEKNLDIAEHLLKSLHDHNSSFISLLQGYIAHQKNGEANDASKALLLKSAEAFNPIAIYNHLHHKMNNELSVNDYMKIMPLVSVMYKALLNTHYRPLVDKLIKSMCDDLIKLTITKEAIPVSTYQPTMFAKPTTKELPKLWIAMAEMFENTNQHRNKYFALQQAQALNPKYKTNLLTALGITSNSDIDITNLLNNFNLLLTKTNESLAGIDDPATLDSIQYDADVEYQNNKIIFEYYLPKKSANDVRDMSKLFQQVSDQYATLKKHIEEKIESVQQKTTETPRLT